MNQANDNYVPTAKVQPNKNQAKHKHKHYTPTSHKPWQLDLLYNTPVLKNVHQHNDNQSSSYCIHI